MAHEGFWRSADSGRSAHVFECRKRRKNLRDLKRARDANSCDGAGRQAGNIPFLEVDRTLRRLQVTGDQINEGGLPRTIGPNYANRLMRRYLERDIARRD